MDPFKNDKELDELISRAIGREKQKFDFNKWKETHKKEIEAFRAQSPSTKLRIIANRETLGFGRVFDTGRIIMRSRIAKLAAAAVIVIAVTLGLTTIIEKSATPAYAIEETIDALQYVTTVHMFGRDWDDDEFEIWATLSPETGKPDYCFLDMPAHEAIVVSTPSVSYQYMKKINQVQVNKGMLLHFDLRFEQILEDTVKAMANKKENESFEIYTEKNLDTGKDVIVVIGEKKNHAWKIIIDPQTKLPLSIHLLRSNKPGEFIKDVDEIYFDEELPDGIFEFEIPEGVTVMDIDLNSSLFADPNYGISAEGLTRQEAANRIVKEYWEAIIAVDMNRLKKVFPITKSDEATSDQVMAKYKEAFGEYMPVELVETGELYVEHNCGLGPVIPCTVKLEDGSLKEFNLIIKFRKIDGQSSCVIAGHYGYPRDIE